MFLSGNFTDSRTSASSRILIHFGRPTDPANRDHYFCTDFRPYVRPHFSKYRKRRVKIMITTGETVGLAEGIIDDTCLDNYQSKRTTYCTKF